MYKAWIVGIIGAAKLGLAAFCAVQYLRTDLPFYVLAGFVSLIAGLFWFYQVPGVIASVHRERAYRARSAALRAEIADLLNGG